MTRFLFKHANEIATAALTVLFFPLVASTLTGDISRHFPAAIFSDGSAGKDQIVIISAASTLLLVIILATTAVWAIKLIFRLLGLRSDR